MTKQLTNKLQQYLLLMRFHKPIGIYLLLWPTLWALWIAGHGRPSLMIVIIFVLGVIVMRAAGCVINDFADRNFDAFVERTKDRPIAAGKVSAPEALLLFFGLALIAFGLVLLLNRLTILLALVGAALMTLYPFMKRFTHLPQLILGIAFAWSIPMAFAAQTGAVPGIAWLVFLVAALLTVAYDTMYAMADRADDLQIGLKSTAILFGNADKGIVAIIQAVILLLLIYIGISLKFNIYYYLSLIIAAALFCYQQWLIKNRAPQRCFKAFLNNNWFGMVVFIGIALNYYF